MNTRARILRAVEAELESQDARWGSQRLILPRGWVPILGEEFGEVCRAVCERNPESYRDELIQLAAVAIQAAQAYDQVAIEGGALIEEAPRFTRKES